MNEISACLKWTRVEPIQTKLPFTSLGISSSVEDMATLLFVRSGSSRSTHSWCSGVYERTTPDADIVGLAVNAARRASAKVDALRVARRTTSRCAHPTTRSAMFRERCPFIRFASPTRRFITSALSAKRANAISVKNSSQWCRCSVGIAHPQRSSALQKCRR